MYNILYKIAEKNIMIYLLLKKKKKKEFLKYNANYQIAYFWFI